MKNQGGYLSIILTIVVAMVLMVGGAYVWLGSDLAKEAANNKEEYQPVQELTKEDDDKTPEEMSWQTYSDENFGLSFDYPSKLGDQLEISTDKITLGNEHLGFRMHISKATEDPTLNMEDVVFDRSTKIINDLSYREFWIQGMGSGYGYILHDENFGDYYIFTSVWGPTNETFENIMKSVSLKKVIPSRPTADWRTYINSEYGYSIKLPEDWTAFSEYDGSSYDVDKNKGPLLTIGKNDSEEIGLWVHYSSNVNAISEVVDFYFSKFEKMEDFTNAEGLEGKLLIYPESEEKRYLKKVYLFENNDKTYSLSMMYDTELALDVVNTLKFLEDQKTSDTGKECTDSSQCEGYCTTDLPEIYMKIISENGPMEMTGNCSEEYELTGCYSMVKNGFVDGIECVK